MVVIEKSFDFKGPDLQFGEGGCRVATLQLIAL
jgi:hypothetical protein